MSTARFGHGPYDEPGLMAQTAASLSAGLDGASSSTPDTGGSTSQEFSISGLAGKTAAFAASFERWAHRRAIEAGASIPRLHLLYSLRCNGPQKMADLADQLSVTPRNVTALVDGLEVDRLVRRVPHSTDRRVTLVELTGNADLVAAQFMTYQASIESLLSSLEEADQRTLFRLLEVLRDRMHAEPGCSEAGEEASDA